MTVLFLLKVNPFNLRIKIDGTDEKNMLHVHVLQFAVLVRPSPEVIKKMLNSPEHEFFPACKS